MPTIESLESRRHLDAAPIATVTSRGTLLVVGTAGEDAIAVAPLGNDYRVTRATTVRSGDTTTTSTTETTVRVPDGVRVRRVEVDAGGGDDRVTVERTIGLPALLLGGNGDDLLVGGRGADTLSGGAGKDTLVGSGVGASARGRFTFRVGDDGTTAYQVGLTDGVVSGTTYARVGSTQTQLVNVAAADTSLGYALADDDLRDVLAGGAGDDRYVYAKRGDRPNDLTDATSADQITTVLKRGGQRFFVNGTRLGSLSLSVLGPNATDDPEGFAYVHTPN